MSVFWWVKLDLFSLEYNEVSRSEFWGVHGFGVIFGCLYVNVQCYVPVLLENLRGMSCSGACWPLGLMSLPAPQAGSRRMINGHGAGSNHQWGGTPTMSLLC